MVEFLPGGMVVVAEVEDPFEVVPHCVIDCRGAIGFMDHVCESVAGSGKGVVFQLFDPFGKFPSGPVDFREAEDADMPAQLLQR